VETPFVMPGLDPGIHLLQKMMDCRVKPGNDVLLYCGISEAARADACAASHSGYR
jgi:hypothetical protein